MDLAELNTFLESVDPKIEEFIEKLHDSINIKTLQTLSEYDDFIESIEISEEMKFMAKNGFYLELSNMFLSVFNDYALISLSNSRTNYEFSAILKTINDMIENVVSQEEYITDSVRAVRKH